MLGLENGCFSKIFINLRLCVPFYFYNETFMTELNTNDNTLDSFFDNALPNDSKTPVKAKRTRQKATETAEAIATEAMAITDTLDIAKDTQSMTKISPISTKIESEIEDGIESIKLEANVQNDVADSTTDNDTDDNAFELLGLAPVLLKSIAATGYTTPTPIQAQAIPAAMNGRDLLLSAQTGSGKTAAFVLPILHNLDQNPQETKKNQAPKVKALILTPTRELAHQVGDSIRKYGSSMRGIFSVPLVGGAAYSGQIRALKKGVHIIVATPGRLLDHINAGRIDLSQLEMLVLDEADRMLDMGFADDIEAILAATPASRQTIMSSATWDGPVGKIAESFTDNPERISIKVETAHIDESVYFCDNFDHKNKIMEHLICDPELDQAIVFTATKRSSEELAERLQEWGHKACYLHGDLPQSKRNRIVADLRSGKYDIVVATDVAARGLDLPNITHVFNYDLPRQVEDYVHRIGRSGRAGRTGIAINLCSRDDRRQFANISRYLKRDIQESTVDGLEPRFVEKFDSRGRNGGGRDRNRSQDRNGGRGKSYGNERGGYRNDRNSDRSSGGERRSAVSERSDKPRFNRDDSRGDNRFDNRNEWGDSRQDNRFERSAKPSDRPSYRDVGRDSSRNSHRDSSRDGYQKRTDSRDSYRENYQGDRPRSARSERSDDRGSRSDEKNSRFGDRPFSQKPRYEGQSRSEGLHDGQARRSRGVTEQRFGGSSDRANYSNSRSDKPFERKSESSGYRSDRNSSERGGFKPRNGETKSFERNERPSFGRGRSERGELGSQDGFDAPKRSRRDSTGKPL